MGSEFILTRASAGSGKTYALSRRFAEFLLTEACPGDVPRSLGNILAITFTRNAAREMKERILDWLKEGYRGEGKKSTELCDRLHITPDELSRRAEAAVERILDGYTDFQVDTIDSFAAMIFRASAVDLGYGPDFEIVLSPRELLDYAFACFLRRVKPAGPEGEAFRQILDYLLLQEGEKSRFLWDPTQKIGEKLAAFQKKLAGRPGELILDDCRKEKTEVAKKIRAIAEGLKKLVAESGLEVTTRGHYATRILPAIAEERWADLLDCSFKSFPVKKSGKRSPEAAAAIEVIEADWNDLQALVGALARFSAEDFFLPYLRAYQSVQAEMSFAKHSRGLLFLDDVNRELHRYLDRGIVPDVYFRLGDRIYHYLIDEFQDTSPIQWLILKPLIEESLGRGGSLFLVGDRKQAIYGFRDADFRIMSRLESGEESFGPAETTLRELTNNYRSEGEILSFVQDVFLKLRPMSEGGDEEDEAQDKATDYGRLAGLSGLNRFEQDVLDERKRRGYVRYVLFNPKEKFEDPLKEKTESENSGEASEERPDREAPEKKEIQDLVAELKSRGFRWADMAVLAARNEDVAAVASWLNEADVDIISYSNLDIRRRKIIGEILSFLRFCDAPPDDLAFAEFLLGDLFSTIVRETFSLEARREFLRECYRDKARPCYAALRLRHPALWEQYFEPFFKSVGYLPLYDLVTRMYREFDVYALFPGEEAALTKLLEAIKGFEGEGRNDLREFLDFSAEEEDEENRWTIDVPRDIDAVKIMSIHKAKGATIPVVICLLYGQAFKGSEFYLQEKDDGVHVFKINKAWAEADALLGRIYREAKDREWVDKLNSLYVALTRAQHELYIVGVKDNRGKYPFELLESAFPANDSAAVGGTADASRRIFERGNPQRKEDYLRPKDRDRRDAPAASAPRQEIERRSGFSEPPTNIRESLNSAGIRRGEWIHKILAGLEFVRAGWPEDLASSLEALRPSPSENNTAGEARAVLLRAPGKSISPEWFEPRPGRLIYREFDVCDAGGDVSRMDRVIVDPDSVLVIDFKTGRQPQFAEEYREQIRRYCELLKGLYPGRSVCGVLAYLDQDRIEEVG